MYCLYASLLYSIFGITNVSITYTLLNFAVFKRNYFNLGLNRPGFNTQPGL